MQTAGCCIRRLSLRWSLGVSYPQLMAMTLTTPSSLSPKRYKFASASCGIHGKAPEAYMRGQNPVSKTARAASIASQSLQRRGCLQSSSASSGRNPAVQALASGQDALHASEHLDNSAASKLSQGDEGSQLPHPDSRAAEVTTAGCSSEQSEPSSSEPQEQEQQQDPKPKKAVVLPTPISPPDLPTSLDPWQNGVLLIDKPKTWTSFDVCAKLKGAIKQFKVKKVGHAGTLDPMATGLLIVCVGRGTKAIDTFMGMTKEYTGTLRLGEGTPSYDADTEVSEKLPWEHITDAQVLAAREEFVGDILQVPPMFSALRVGGKRLYEVARKGGEVEREPRAVTVESFELHRDPSDRQCFHFRVVCSKGTYIRSLAHDLGRRLGSVAHLTALRREAIGAYRVEHAWQIKDLSEKLYQQKRTRREAEAEAEPQQQGETLAAAAAASDPST